MKLSHFCKLICLIAALIFATATTPMGAAAQVNSLTRSEAAGKPADVEESEQSATDEALDIIEDLIKRVRKGQYVWILWISVNAHFLLEDGIDCNEEDVCGRLCRILAELRELMSLPGLSTDAVGALGQAISDVAQMIAECNCDCGTT